MLLVAVALLLGANNVKAGETPVWESSFDKNNVVSVEWNNNIQVSEGDKIRIYVYDRNLFVEGNWSTPLELENGKDGSPSFSSYNSTGNYYELKFKENSVSVLKQQGFKYTKSDYFNITKITISDASGNEEDITYDTGSSKFQNFTTEHSIRFYGTHSTYGYLYVYAGWGESYAILKNSSNNKNYLECTIADAVNGYIETTIDAEGIDNWKNKGGMKIRHNNDGVSSLGVSKVTVVSGGTTPSTKTDVTLTYSATTASATTASIGQTLTDAPTLTSSVEGLTYTYESSNTTVAEINSEGVVTIKGAGTTIIKAIFTGDDTYNRAEASYTLTVTEATYAITILEPENGQITVSATEATANTTITITATPNDGYKLSAVSVKAGDTNIEVSGTGNARTFTMPSQDVTVNATFTEIETVVATITSNTGFATFCSNKALDFTGINTIEAYYAKTVENGNVYLLRIYGTVKAGTGLVLKGATTRIPVAESGDELEGNMLIGVSADTDVNASTDYVLTEKNGVAVFAQTGVNKATVAAGHAYLRVPVAQARTRAIGIGGEGTTGIDNTFIDNCEQGEMVIYNLGGQRVKNAAKGLFIINGKKKILK